MPLKGFSNFLGFFRPLSVLLCAAQNCTYLGPLSLFRCSRGPQDAILHGA
ncbi:hypothetical protein C8R44DRAFT_781546 [Mycena epipterygia]|nr:hypothetical protein C8R44DRAFT_781546 [Mycena epipterygia]